MNQDFYTLEEFAKLLRITPKTAGVLLKKKKIYGSKCGRKWVIPRTTVERLYGGEINIKKEEVKS